SLLYRPYDESPDERTLREQEHDRDRDDREQRRERELGPEDVDLLTAAPDRRIERRGRGQQVGETDLDRVLRRVRKHGVRKEEVVPVRDEAEEEHQRDHRLGERQRDATKRLPLAAAVRASGVEQLRGDRRRVVDVREIDAERVERERQDHGEHAADQMQRVELEEDRQDERRGG